ncbi:Pycsar system effector family protein [Kitasatospora cineracea]|uniref:Pycsar system effector family protein n=1 Tax=Kitasatospora cineracea TaxID=88074 RepID=UPI0034060EA9
MDTTTTPPGTPAAGQARPQRGPGLSPQADRALERALTVAQFEVGRTDTKGGLLLALDTGIAGTGTAAAALGAIPSAALAPVAVGVLTLAAAAILALLAVMPRLRPAPEAPGSTWPAPDSHDGFLGWARCTNADELLRVLAEEHRPQSINRLSRLGERKYRLLAWSVRLNIATTAAALLALSDR